MSAVKRNFLLIVISTGVIGALAFIMSIIMSIYPDLMLNSLMGEEGISDPIRGLVAFLSLILGPIVGMVFAVMAIIWASAAIGFSFIAKSLYSRTPRGVNKYRLMMTLVLFIYGFPALKMFVSALLSWIMGSFSWITLLVSSVVICITIICCINTYSDRIKR